ncbi:hypothetical protein O7632_03770 [Solwaraspora sp. WMMD406]|uniref:hypothetical protein n=1 Tax=Solwaraspora sp. WMMD406 TaxID=3016095 RepID=UPI0024177597|nr:hypothetical protein [Solwaraspora sp. WMMD406]MDG4763231.1 hypothetical protein [Solwaraspora sp. WMMD406]
MDQFAGTLTPDYSTARRPAANLDRAAARPTGRTGSVFPREHGRCDDPTCGNCYQRPETD